jgi:hypothetical protein
MEAPFSTSDTMLNSQCVSRKQKRRVREHAGEHGSHISRIPKLQRIIPFFAKFSPGLLNIAKFNHVPYGI